ncbi:hypothetical protein BDK51DRAFT_51887 [Blyttiomyces helicus]|uniref:Uncharacterized protein n=1 Tax=Blyttiomyces helicus TaxID=388810 RepID=A0A4V1IPR8_9FUNG|nr:hypothetical protein BDK51DRAFT_51887 [Blyttiomyces helicus]|eukprot:RKO84007.1 hypothetical protein BDK51DRAFT_51887 [Blyttiomyces helicus]
MRNQWCSARVWERRKGHRGYDTDSDGDGTLAWPARASCASPQPSLGAQVQNAFADDTDSDGDGTLAWPALASCESPQPSLGAQVWNAFADDTDSNGDGTVMWPHSHTHDAAADEPQRTLVLPDTDHPHRSPLSPLRRSKSSGILAAQQGQLWYSNIKDRNAAFPRNRSAADSKHGTGRSERAPSGTVVKVVHEPGRRGSCQDKR